MSKKIEQIPTAMAASARCIEQMTSQYHRESLRTFYLFLDVYQHLITGKVQKYFLYLVLNFISPFFIRLKRASHH